MSGMYGFAAKPEQRTTNRARKCSPVLVSSVQVFCRSSKVIAVTRGQLDFEWRHLMAKLQARSPEQHERWRDTVAPEAHPLFVVTDGNVASWERAAPAPP